MKRRDFLINGAAVTAALPFSGFTQAAALPSEEPRSLNLYNIHTGEQVRTEFMTPDGHFIPEGVEALDHLLRDHRSGHSTLISRTLYEDLHTLQTLFRSSLPMEIISGYRSPQTNNYLRSLGKKVSQRSLHMQGKAIDIRIPGADMSKVCKAALALKSGGVGYYPKSRFIHLDVGRVRQWSA